MYFPSHVTWRFLVSVVVKGVVVISQGKRTLRGGLMEQGVGLVRTCVCVCVIKEDREREREREWKRTRLGCFFCECNEYGKQRSKNDLQDLTTYLRIFIHHCFEGTSVNDVSNIKSVSFFRELYVINAWR